MSVSTINFIVTTIGRPSLRATVASVERWDGDELLVIKHDPPGGNWGNADFYFISSTGWGNRYGFAWREEVTVLMGHDDPYVFVNNKGRLREGVV